MLLWRNLGCVAGKNTIQWQFQGTLDAAPRLDVVLIEVKWSDLRAEAKGGEEITAEEQLVFGGVVAAMTMGVARERDDTESAPDGQLVAIVLSFFGAK